MFDLDPPMAKLGLRGSDVNESQSHSHKRCRTGPFTRYETKWEGWLRRDTSPSVRLNTELLGVDFLASAQMLPVKVVPELVSAKR